jgi:hypothetical protein
MYKNVSQLKLTNEIQHFVDLCISEDKFLMIKVPDICEISPKLQRLIDEVTDENRQSRIRILRQPT